QLKDAVRDVTTTYQQEALVEEYIDGREVCIGLLGHREIESLPPVELDFSGRTMRLMTWDDKFHKRADEPRRICPAPIAEELARRCRAVALDTFRACHCRDYSRVDIRIDERGGVWVLEINSMAALGEQSSFMTAARAAGYNETTLVNRILDLS